MATNVSDFSDLLKNYREQFFDEGCNSNSYNVAWEYNHYKNETNSEKKLQLQEDLYRSLFSKMSDSNETSAFMMNDGSQNNGTRTDNLWIDVTNGSAAHRFGAAAENCNTYEDRIREAEKKRDNCKKMFENAAGDDKEYTEQALKAAEDDIKSLNNKLTAEKEIFSQTALLNEIANTKKQLAQGLSISYGATSFGNDISPNDSAKKLATLETQYFNKYEKQTLAGEDLKKRQAEIDKLTELYPDCTKYEYQFGDNYYTDQTQVTCIVAGSSSNNGIVSDNKDKAAESNSNSMPSVKAGNQMTDADKKAFIEDFKKKYPNGNNDGFTSSNEFMSTKREYIRYQQDLGLTLSNADKQWAVDDFEKNPPSINSRSDSEAYSKKKAFVDKYKSDLGTTVKPNPYAYNKSSAITEEEHINKINNEVADRVIRGDYGCGQERFDKLSAAGYDYSQVQSIVNQKMAAYNAQMQSKTDVQKAESIAAPAVNAEKSIGQKMPSKQLEINQPIVANIERTKSASIQTENSVSKEHVEKTVTTIPEPVAKQETTTKAKTVTAGPRNVAVEPIDNTEAVNRLTARIDNSKLFDPYIRATDNSTKAEKIRMLDKAANCETKETAKTVNTIDYER